jgi:hypothetical protein
MDDNDAHHLMQQQAALLLANRQQRIGPCKRHTNFKIDEDLKLASAYALVGTNAAVGTGDQDGNMFWQRVCENFMRRGGTPERTIISLQLPNPWLIVHLFLLMLIRVEFIC